MNDDQVFRLLAETNPVPNVDGVASPVALDEIDQGGPTMAIDMKLESRPEPEAKPPPRAHRGPWLAAAAAVVALVAGAAVWAISGGGDELADHPGMASVTAAYEAMNNGDVDGFYAQLTERAVEADDHEYRALEAEMNQRTERDGSCRLLEPSPTSGLDRIQCDVLFTNDFFRPAGISVLSRDTFVIADDGRIDVIITELPDRAEADAYAHAFWPWLAAAHPEVYNTMWVVRPDPDTVPAFTAFAHTDAKLTALEYIDEFLEQSDQYPLSESG